MEGVTIDMDKNQVTIKGVVEPEAICNMIMKKTKRNAKVLSPLPPNEGEPMPQVVTSQVTFLPFNFHTILITSINLFLMSHQTN